MEAQHQLDNEDEVDEQLFRRVRREEHTDEFGDTPQDPKK